MSDCETAARALLAACLLVAAAAAPAPAPPLDTTLNAFGRPLLTPTNLTMRGRSVYYEIPIKAIGTLALMHGCAHDASDFWPRAACPECDGLPEEVAHTRQALARGYAVVAVDAKDPSRCFSWQLDKDDVAAILSSWLKQANMTGKPVYLLGVSAGASFALKLPALVRVQGVISEVLGVEPTAWSSANELGASFPPTAYISMPRDTRTAGRIAADQDILRRLGVPTDLLLVNPQPLTPDFLSNRSEKISPEVAVKVVAALQGTGLVNGSGTLLQDPRYTIIPWRSQLAAAVPELSGQGDSLVPDASHVGEELNRAFANHEIVGDYVTACLAWLESRGTAPLAGLAQQFASVGLPSPRLRDLSPVRLRMLPMRVRKAAAAARRRRRQF